MRTHRIVLKWVEDQLAAGSLSVGDKLPAERLLAEQLEVSRTSVREAIRVLEAMGVLRIGVGSGAQAGTVVIAEPGAALGSALRLHVATSHLPVEDIVQTRVLLESWAAAHASPQAPQLEEAAKILAEMDTAADATGDGGTSETPERIAEFLAQDVQFHLLLAAAAGNAVVTAMMASLRESIESYAHTLTANLPDWDSTTVRLRAEHHGILNAVAAGNPKQAARLVTEHIQGYYREAGLAATHKL
ncbi:FadR/GntR family transcriptional regulator [Pseudarthrobacter sp. J1738]|uniref:FadR/GntR family transcriptional regulator n=1 Tax=unclassified Pseudarthrobacter TaxID=2647000 RepID=UPI003D289755